MCRGAGPAMIGASVPTSTRGGRPHALDVEAHATRRSRGAVTDVEVVGWVCRAVAVALLATAGLVLWASRGGDRGPDAWQRVGSLAGFGCLVLVVAMAVD